MKNDKNVRVQLMFEFQLLSAQWSDNISLNTVSDELCPGIIVGTINW